MLALTGGTISGSEESEDNDPPSLKHKKKVKKKGMTLLQGDNYLIDR
jgi:hypothetical protein